MHKPGKIRDIVKQLKKCNKLVTVFWNKMNNKSIPEIVTKTVISVLQKQLIKISKRVPDNAK